MDHLSQFVGHHVLLCSGFIATLFAVFFLESYLVSSAADRLTPQAVTHAMNRESAVVVDIRDASSFRDGHIVGAINIPAADWAIQEKKLIKYQTKPLIVVDALGQKSQTYKVKLTKAGFSKVSMLAGGMSAWRTSGLPLVKEGK